MTATVDLIHQIGPPVDSVEPTKLTKRGVEVVITEHEKGWSIIGSRSDRQPLRGARRPNVWIADPYGPFVGVVWRCTPDSCRCALHPYEHRRSQDCQPHERTCLGHAEKVKTLARKVLDAYRASA